MAWEKLGTTSVGGSVANTSWKELGRTTLGSSSAEVDKSSLTAKDNIMILAYYTGDSTADSFINFNGDEAGNYASRYSRDGGSDSTDTSQSVGLRLEQGRTTPQFSVMNITNISAQEKLVNGHTVSQNTAGAGNEPHRQEWVGKWANTSAQITQATLDRASGNFTSGSEIVVLGYDDDEADSGTNFWQELASVTRTDNGSTLESGNFAAKKYLMVEACTIPANNGFKGRLEFGHSNGTMDTGSNYTDRYSQDGGSHSAQANGSYIYAYTNHDDNIQHLKMFIVNKSDKEKLVLWWASSGGSSTGAGNVPQRRDGVAKWTNTSNQITNIRLNNQVAGGDAASGSYIKVYGAD